MYDYCEMNPIPNAIDDIAQQLSREIAAKKDSVIREAITRALGHEQWSVAEMIGRMSRTQDERSVDSSWTWWLDGRAILRTWPVNSGSETWTHEWGEQESRMKLTLNYLFLVPASS